MLSAVIAVSHEIFSGRFVLFVVKKEFNLMQAVPISARWPAAQPGGQAARNQ